jgi:hypothetical protein
MLPYNQIDAQASQFDLLTVAGETQRLEILVENTGPEPISVTVETVAASTNRDGRLHYISAGFLDETMAHPFSALATPEETLLEIPAYEARTAAVALTMPDEPIRGVVLGAIRLVRVPDPEDEGDGAGIVNQYSYVVGVRLRHAAALENREEVIPELTLGDVHGDMVNHKAAIVVEIRNKTPIIAREIAVEAQIFEAEHEDTPVIEKRQDSVEMAPNSIFPLSLVDQAGYGFPAGEYIAAITLTRDTEIQTFRKAFTIYPDEAQAVNGSAVNQAQNQRPPETKGQYGWVLAVVGLDVLAVILCRVRFGAQHAKRG